MTDTSEGSAFERDVVAVLRSLRKGDVVTYGEVALEAGYPGRARAVGALLSAGTHRVPWWRVVNASGRLVPGHEVAQAERLRDEGVEVDLNAKRVRRPRRARTGRR
jgi:methylated-DNA-protein-cysteine methyltransferase-like protein